MKFITLLLLAFICVNCSDSTRFAKLINCVPFDETVIGSINLYETDSIWYDYNNNPWVLSWDTNKDFENNFKLNNYFKYESFKDSMNNQYSLLDNNSALIFAKRLPKKGVNETLLYYIERFSSNFPNEKYPQWLLISVNENGEITQALVVAEVDRLEMDVIKQKLFLIQEGNLLIKTFLGVIEDEDEVDWHNPEYLYTQNSLIIPLIDL